MNAPTNETAKCRVIGSEKLPPAAGGADALCRSIEAAASARVRDLGYKVEVRVLSTSRLAAKLTTADGRTLPEINHAISDSTLTGKSVERFAQAIAAELEKSAPR